jgi:hypothetical protein
MLIFDIDALGVFINYRSDIIMDMRLSTRSNDGESSVSSKHQKVGDHAAEGSNLERLRRNHGFSLETTPTAARTQVLYEANVDEEVVFIDNPLFDEDRLLPVSLNNKVDQARVVQKYHCSSAGSATEQGKQLVDMMIENQRRESDMAANQCFESEFVSNLEKRNISIKSIDANINRHTPIKDVRKAGEKILGRKKAIDFAIAFAVARGKAVIEKIRTAPYDDTTQDFQNRYSPEVGEPDKEGYYMVYTKVKGSEKASYTHRINPSKGIAQVLGEGIDKDHDKSIYLAGTKVLEYSNIFYHTYKAVVLKASKSGENCSWPKEIFHRNIINQETAQTSSLFTKGSSSFKNGSDEYYAMIGVANCYGMSYFLEQYKHYIGNKEIAEIEINGGYLGEVRIFIGDKA